MSNANHYRQTFEFFQRLEPYLIASIEDENPLAWLASSDLWLSATFQVNLRFAAISILQNFDWPTLLDRKRFRQRFEQYHFGLIFPTNANGLKKPHIGWLLRKGSKNLQISNPDENPLARSRSTVEKATEDTSKLKLDLADLNLFRCLLEVFSRQVICYPVIMWGEMTAEHYTILTEYKTVDIMSMKDSVSSRPYILIV